MIYYFFNSIIYLFNTDSFDRLIHFSQFKLIFPSYTDKQVLSQYQENVLYTVGVYFMSLLFDTKCRGEDLEAVVVLTKVNATKSCDDFVEFKNKGEMYFCSLLYHRKKFWKL